MKSIKCIVPQQAGWIEVELDNTEIDFLWKSIENKGKSHKSELVGNIDSSYEIFDKDNWFYNNTLVKLCNAYAESFNNIGSNLPTVYKHPYFLQSMWVNYQKQTEFNPTHYHKGIYSFVIWMKIPTHYKDQQKLPISSNSTSGVISNFEFSYIDLFGRIRSYEYLMRPELEGTLVFFPAKMVHQVYPFFECDEERISISGNILVNTAKRL